MGSLSSLLHPPGTFLPSFLISNFKRPSRDIAALGPADRWPEALAYRSDLHTEGEASGLMQEEGEELLA